MKLSDTLFGSGLGLGGKTVNPITIDNRNPQRQQLDQFLSNFVSNYGSQYQPQKSYDGQLTAPMSRFESSGLDTFLQNYLQAPDVSQNMGDVRNLLSKTVNGGFDPGSSDYYQALRDASGYNRAQAIKNTNADLGGRGKFFSSEAVQKYGDINAQTAIGLNQTMADLADRERTRSMGAIPQASQLEQYISGVPLQKAKAATTIGALPRELEQNDLEAHYQDFLRKQKEGAGVFGFAGDVSNAQTQQGYPNPPLQQNGSQQTGQMISQFLPYLMMMMA